MSNRLKSFQGPSTPSSSPVSHRQLPKSPASPSRQTESTFHRKTRTLLQELRSVAQTWDDLVLIDGLNAAKELTDTRTDLEYVWNLCNTSCSINFSRNALKLIPDGRPRTHLVRPKLATMDDCITKLDVVIAKLVGWKWVCRVFSNWDFQSENNSSGWTT